MIRQIKFGTAAAASHKNAPASFRYLAGAQNLVNRTFTFAPGLNILVGRNGSGKSTVLRACAMSLAALQGGVSTVTETWLLDLFGVCNTGLHVPWEIVHDGQPILFKDPRKKIGCIDGHLDQDFCGTGIFETINKASSGEKTMHRIDSIVGLIMGHGKFPESIDWRVGGDGYNSTWRERCRSAEQFMAPQIEKGSSTILMDEPESGLALPLEVVLWKRIIAEDPARFDNLQVIVATHSPFAFGIPHANYIEMEEGYIAECENALRFAKLQSSKG